jgi:hypothetical protein
MKTLLSSRVSVADYKKMEKDRDVQAIANFVRERFTERYITPMRVDTKKKNGFTIMAVSCLSIEALESFYQGWPESNNRSQLAFCNFFDRNQGFHFIRGQSQSFYKNVRCGILHQAEKTGGWHISRKGPIFDKKTKTINAKKFHDEIEKALSSYCTELQRSDWSASVWEALKRKMHSVCKNCESKA